MKTLITLALVFTCSFLSAQNLIAVEHNGSSTFYATLDEAVNAAQNGDNVYVPGGSFTLVVPISKGFNLIGVGYNPDSCVATGVTIITNPNGYVTISGGSDNGSITGIYFFNSGVRFANPVNNFIISRCRIIIDNNTTCSNIVVSENIIDGFISGSFTNCQFSRNIIGGYVAFIQGPALFNNNIFLFPASSQGTVLNGLSDVTFNNNIFLWNGGYPFMSGGSYGALFFNNNIFVTPSNPVQAQFPNLGALYGVTKLFVNQSGNVYDFHHDYHLKSGSPGKNYGTDGTDVGVYGTASPFKPGGVPYNPHVQLQSVGSYTDNSGNLSVNIKVAAQKN